MEVWVALLLYGGAVMDDLAWFGGRAIRPLFGWSRIPNPTTFGRWLRRAGSALVPVLDELIWHLVRSRWIEVGVPEGVTLVLDSTVAVRYGAKQAGAEKGYNPKKRGRPSHHPMIATLAETGDLMGIRWRPGSASAAGGAAEWLPLLVARLREAGVSDITVRLDKGFFSRAMVECLQELGVSFLLKVPDHHWVRGALGPMRRSAKSLEITRDPDLAIWSGSGTLYDARLLSLEWRRTEEAGRELFDSVRITQRSHVLTNLPGLHALTAWRMYNDGAVVEQRIEELAQLGAGRTAVNDLGGNALLWQMAGLLPAPACHPLHRAPRLLAHGPAQPAPELDLPHARQAHPARSEDLPPTPPLRARPPSPPSRAPNHRPTPGASTPRRSRLNGVGILALPPPVTPGAGSGVSARLLGCPETAAKPPSHPSQAPPTDPRPPSSSPDHPP